MRWRGWKRGSMDLYVSKQCVLADRERERGKGRN